MKGYQGRKQTHTISVRGLKINKDSRQAYVNGKEIELTAKEFGLLLFIVMHPNYIFSKEHLFERIGGLDSMGDLTTVTVHILREKIETDPSNPQYIITVWGAGYRFDA